MTKKYRSINRKKTRKYRKYGGTPSPLDNSKNKVESILSRVKSNQAESRSNTQKMYEYKKRLDNKRYEPQYDLGEAPRDNPIYDIGQALSSETIKINTVDKREKLTLIKLTPENVNQYIGYSILFKSRNKYIVKKILSISKTGKSIKIEEPDLQNSLEIVSRNVYAIVEKSPLYDSVQVAYPLKPKNTTKKSIVVNKSGSPLYDLGQAESGSPLYDLGQAKSGSPIYDLGQAESGSPLYDLGQAKSGSPIYDLGQAEPLYDIGQADEDPTGQTTMKLDITAGSWDFYTLKIVDSQPKTEKELCEIMKVRFPERITGKTPCNTLNKVLQTLVKHGYISRISFKTKGTQKRQNYKYFKKDVPKKTDYIEIMPKSIEQETPIQDESTLSEPSETFKLIVKKVLDKNKIYTRDDLIKFCNGSDRTKLYDAVKKECPPRKCDGKHFKSIVRKTYEELLSGFKLYKVSKV
jgi:hypothetical protein